MLTSQGKTISKPSYRRYALIFQFLTECLGIDTDTAKRNSCAMEHAISPEAFASLCNEKDIRILSILMPSQVNVLFHH